MKRRLFPEEVQKVQGSHVLVIAASTSLKENPDALKLLKSYIYDFSYHYYIVADNTDFEKRIASMIYPDELFVCGQRANGGFNYEINDESHCWLVPDGKQDKGMVAQYKRMMWLARHSSNPEFLAIWDGYSEDVKLILEASTKFGISGRLEVYPLSKTDLAKLKRK